MYESLPAMIGQYVRSEAPGIQYMMNNADGPIFECAAGFADLSAHTPMTMDTTLMAYSMTKTITAVAVLQLVERGMVRLDDSVDQYLESTAYTGQGILIRHLLTHTSGIPNPIPLRWVHLVDESATFDEVAALERVLRAYPRLVFKPGTKYLYSNIGYWILGRIVARVTGTGFTNFVSAAIIGVLGIARGSLGFTIENRARHARGYLAKFSMMNLAKWLVTDRKFWGRYQGNWLNLRDHYPNGPAFGGLVGSSRGFSKFLQDQLRQHSVLLSPASRQSAGTPQATYSGMPIPMSLAWHVRKLNDITVLFKEGGGGGFHCEMRLYPSKGFASVVMTNSTGFNSSRFLDRLDGGFIRSHEEH